MIPEHKIYGKEHQVEVVISNYNEDQVFKGMVIENITQRTNDFMELNENIVAIESYLNSKSEILQALRESRKGSKHSPLLSEQKQLQKATSSDISFWIDKKSEEVISHDVITQNLNIFHKLDPELRKDVEKKHDKTKEEREEENLNYTQAVYLSGIEGYKEQNELKKVLNKSREQRVREQAKHKKTFKVKKGKETIADYTATTKKPKSKNVFGVRYANLEYQKRKLRKILKDPSSKYRWEKDISTLDKINQAEMRDFLFD